jgi:hypothetical protein
VVVVVGGSGATKGRTGVGSVVAVVGGTVEVVVADDGGDVTLVVVVELLDDGGGGSELAGLTVRIPVNAPPVP